MSFIHFLFYFPSVRLFISSVVFLAINTLLPCVVPGASLVFYNWRVFTVLRANRTDPKAFPGPYESLLPTVKRCHILSVQASKLLRLV